MSEQEVVMEDTELVRSVVLAEPSTLNTIGLIGDVTEDTSNEVIFSLLLLHDKLKTDYLNSLASVSSEQDQTPDKPEINFYISTNGGSADEMFGI